MRKPLEEKKNKNKITHFKVGNYFKKKNKIKISGFKVGAKNK